MVCSPALADIKFQLVSYQSFTPADSYRYATALSLIPFDSSGLPDSNCVLPDLICLLAEELPESLYLCSPGKYLQMVGC